MSKTAMIEPLEDRVVIEPAEVESKTPGGIIIPDNAKEKSERGTVVAVGPGRMLDDGDTNPIRLRIGDVVLFSKYAGTEIDHDGDVLVILRECDILARIG